MARPTRVEVPGGWYHVINRGIERKSIYRSDLCRQRFVELLAQMPERFRLRLHGYVLMSNHYHLEIQTEQANLSRAIHWLNASYGIWFNRKYRRVGPLFQGRFKAILHDETEALTINRYIHLNPVRVQRLGAHEGRLAPGGDIGPELREARTQALEEFSWSSYTFYAGNKPCPGWLETRRILEYFGSGSTRRLQLAYRQQLKEAAALGHWETDWKGRVKYAVLLGSEEFVGRARRLLRGDTEQQTGVRQAARGSLAWVEIERAVAAAWNEPWEQLRITRASGAREAALHLGRTQGGFSLLELGALIGGMRSNAVNMALRRFRPRVQQDRKLRARLERAQKILNKA